MFLLFSFVIYPSTGHYGTARLLQDTRRSVQPLLSGHSWLLSPRLSLAVMTVVSQLRRRLEQTGFEGHRPLRKHETSAELLTDAVCVRVCVCVTRADAPRRAE